jgi:glycosyltransferase involved in cell wall biosynthesis
MQTGTILSVCMVTYNHEPFIKQAIEGVLMQKINFPIELVIGEDCSTDSTRGICEEYAQKHKEIIRFLPSEKNLGMISTFLRTYKACSGKYIALCEGDDYWTDPYKLKNQVDFLEAHPDFVICFHDVMILKNGDLIADNITRRVPEETDILELLKGNYLHTASVVFRQGLFSNFPEQYLKAPVGDYFLHMLNAKYGRIKKISKPMAVYRVHTGNFHYNKPQSQKDDEWLTQLSLMIPCFEGEVKNRLISSFIQHARYELLNNLKISVQRQSEIMKLIYEYSPNDFVTIMKEKEILICQQASMSHRVRECFNKLKRKAQHKFKLIFK